MSSEAWSASPEHQASLITDPKDVRFIHSPTLAQTDPAHLLAVWFTGKKERGRDVVLEGARYDLDEKKWSKPRTLVSRQALQRDLGRVIKTIGNPALLSSGRGQVYLFFVTTSLGGWSTSHVNWIESSDAGQTWSGAKRLVLSPLFNMSVLVRNKGFFYEDGSLGLPAYHELASKYALILKLDPEGRLLKMDRIPSQSPDIFQPSVAVLSGREAVAFLRDGGPERKLWISRTLDAGQSWSKAKDSGLPNPNKSVAGEADGQSIYLVFNDSKRTRNNLSLAVSSDGGENWQRAHFFENDPSQPKANFAYPEILVDSRGDTHVVYAYRYERIKHVRFNKMWLTERKAQGAS
ncbi:MAG TPA: sialidase family protein [Candidatus Omnitrophota bacterium]|nr:sialidase family protein [Candidatus Omnitrophota bacterium]